MKEQKVDEKNQKENEIEQLQEEIQQLKKDIEVLPGAIVPLQSNIKLRVTKLCDTDLDKEWQKAKKEQGGSENVISKALRILVVRK
jgi:predicted  nucleic acid-binding Zn-ribbon protein